MGSRQRTGIWTRLAYGFGAVAYGVKDNGFAYLLLFYYDQVLGLPAQWVGAALMCALVVDAISDPVVGFASDNFHSRWGRRHPFMYGAAIPVALSHLLLWNPPADLAPLQLFLWLLVIAILVRTLITFFEIPSTSLVSELTEGYDERTSLLSYRYFFGWWGGLTMAVLAYFVFFPMGGDGPQGQLDAAGYRTYGQTASVIMALAILVSALGTHHRIPTLKQPPVRRERSLRRSWNEFKETISNRSIAVLFFAAISYSLGAGLAAALNIYMNTYFWELSSQRIGWFNVAYFFSAAVALPLSPALSRWLGKKRAAIAMSLAAMAMSPVAISLRLLGGFPANGTDALFYTLMVFNTVEVILIISSSTLISAMVADVVEESELSTGRRSEGVFFAARSFAQKAVSGAGLFSATVLLAAIGFPTEAGPPAEVGDAVLRRLGLSYAASVVACYGISIAFYAAYRISRESHEDHLRRLAETPRAGGEAA